jgi:hypothetical protein
MRLLPRRHLLVGLEVSHGQIYNRSSNPEAAATFKMNSRNTLQ